MPRLAPHLPELVSLTFSRVGTIGKGKRSYEHFEFLEFYPRRIRHYDIDYLPVKDKDGTAIDFANKQVCSHRSLYIYKSSDPANILGFVFKFENVCKTTPSDLNVSNLRYYLTMIIISMTLSPFVLTAFTAAATASAQISSLFLAEVIDVWNAPLRR